ncbi:hypothetical protein HanIR_Chr08g0369221 [Helianthus annuus]|nr:hypothetical protein HanIR_Chr08g0369221 [Helianthus annuus]
MDLILWCEAVHMIFGWLVGGGGYKLHMDRFNTTVFFGCATMHMLVDYLKISNKRAYY